MKAIAKASLYVCFAVVLEFGVYPPHKAEATPLNAALFGFLTGLELMALIHASGYIILWLRQRYPLRQVTMGVA